MKNSIDTTLTELQKNTEDLEHKIDALLEPARKNALKRFPVVFTLLSAFGVATVFFGFERVLMSIPVVNNNPFLILLFGVSILILTGTLYKKL